LQSKHCECRSGESVSTYRLFSQVQADISLAAASLYYLRSSDDDDDDDENDEIDSNNR